MGTLAERIAANIKALRQTRGLSLQAIAAACNPPASYQMIARLESGERGLTVDWLEKIASALGVHPLDLIAGTRDPQTLRMSEQVADEVARVVGRVALDGREPSPGTVQVLALVLQELTESFGRHPQALQNPEVARPVADFAGRRAALSSN